MIGYGLGITGLRSVSVLKLPNIFNLFGKELVFSDSWMAKRVCNVEKGGHYWNNGIVFLL